MVNNSININKMNNYLLPQLIEHKKKTWYITLEIHVLAWDRHKTVAGSNQLYGSQPSRLDKWISKGNINKPCNLW